LGRFPYNKRFGLAPPSFLGFPPKSPLWARKNAPPKGFRPGPPLGWAINITRKFPANPPKNRRPIGAFSGKESLPLVGKIRLAQGPHRHRPVLEDDPRLNRGLSDGRHGRPRHGHKRAPWRAGITGKPRARRFADLPGCKTLQPDPTNGGLHDTPAPLDQSGRPPPPIAVADSGE